MTRPGGMLAKGLALVAMTCWLGACDTVPDAETPPSDDPGMRAPSDEGAPAASGESGVIELDEGLTGEALVAFPNLNVEQMQGNLRVYLTDAPGPYDAVLVTVSKVEAFRLTDDEPNLINAVTDDGLPIPGRNDRGDAGAPDDADEMDGGARNRRMRDAGVARDARVRPDRDRDERDQTAQRPDGGRPDREPKRADRDDAGRPDRDRMAEREERGDWITLSTGVGEMDLLKLRDSVTAILGDAALEPGHYREIRLTVENPSVIVAGVPHKLAIGGRTHALIRLKLNLRVEDGQRYAVVVDFDAEDSIKEKNRGYVMEPVIKIDYIGRVGNDGRPDPLYRRNKAERKALDGDAGTARGNK